MKTPFLLLFLASTAISAFSQDSARKWQPTIGLELTTVPVLNLPGTDSGIATQFSVAPLIAIRSSGGWGIVYSPRIVMGGANPGIYVHSITAGVEQYDKTQFDYAFNYSHYFFTSNTSVPYSPLNNEIYTALTYKKLWLRPMIVAGIGFGKDTTTGASSSAYDIGAAAGVSHSFVWTSGATGFTFAPMLLLNAGTNQYFSMLNFSKYIGHNKNFTKYVNNGNGSTHGSGSGRGGSGVGTSGGTTESAETFSLTNFEIGMESSIETGSFSIRPSGSLYVPLGYAAGTGVFGYWQIVIEYNF